MEDNRNHLRFLFVRAGRIIAVAAVCMAATAMAQPQPTADSRSATTQTVSSPGLVSLDNQRYRIGAGDLLDIHILNRPNLSRDSVRVDGSGMIRMPLIENDIQAACKSEGELAKEISKGYLKYYRNAQVDVFVKEFHAREVALIGSVNSQGRYQMERRIRLLELLTFAKGPSDKAGQTINIIRGPRTDLCTSSANSGDAAGGFISLRLNDTLRGEEKANPYMEAGDIVTIPEAEQVYVIGSVNTPRSLSLKEPITVSRAIAMAGGPQRDAKTDKVHIVRQLANGEKSEIYVNLSAITRKHAEDVMLQPNDIVEVPESTGKSMIRSLLGAVVPSVANLPVRVIP
ncbi:MAG TPA: polysaccharide biosynthesis/export family protein [Pyrinomonadaceae bacterium]|nr:polysaccharide biosynthesis/export family protein [Pyrinomonadaceae bacterium]